MKRITPLQKKIADLHLEAFKNKKFDNPVVHTEQQIREALINGKTFENVFAAIETRYCSVGSSVLSALGCPSQTYKRDIYKGFKKELSIYGIY